MYYYVCEVWERDGLCLQNLSLCAHNSGFLVLFVWIWGGWGEWVRHGLYLKNLSSES